MGELIDKATVVAEIEKLKGKLLRGSCSSQISMETNCKDEAYDKILSFLDTLEVKEVDLEAELNTWRHNHFHGRRDKEASGEYLERVSQLDLAKHFFELGVKSTEVSHLRMNS